MKPLGLCQPKDEGKEMSPCPVSPKDFEPTSAMNQQNDVANDFHLNYEKHDGQFSTDDSKNSSIFMTHSLKNMNGLCNGFMNSHQTSSEYISSNNKIDSDAKNLNSLPVSPLSVSTISDPRVESRSKSISPRVIKTIKRPSLECLVARLHHRVVDNKLNNSLSSFSILTETSGLNEIGEKTLSSDSGSRSVNSETSYSLTINNYKENINSGLVNSSSAGSCSKIAQEEILDENFQCKSCANMPNGHKCQCSNKCLGNKMEIKDNYSSVAPSDEALPIMMCSKALLSVTEEPTRNLICVGASEAKESFQESDKISQSTLKSDIISHYNNNKKDSEYSMELVVIENNDFGKEDSCLNDKLNSKCSANSKCLSIINDDDDGNKNIPKEKLSDIEILDCIDIVNEKSCESSDSKLTPSTSTTPLFSDTPSDASQSEMMVKISDAVAALLSNCSKQASPESSLDIRLKGNSEKLFSNSNSPAEPNQSNINFSCAFKILDLLPEKKDENDCESSPSSKDVEILLKDMNVERSNDNWSCEKISPENITETSTLLINNEDKLKVNNNNNYSEAKEATFNCQYLNDARNCGNETYNKESSLGESSKECSSFDVKKIDSDCVRINGVKDKKFAKTNLCSSGNIDIKDMLSPIVDSLEFEQDNYATNICEDIRVKDQVILRETISETVDLEVISIPSENTSQVEEKCSEKFGCCESNDKNTNQYYNDLLNCKKYINFISNRTCNYFSSRLKENQFNFNFTKVTQTDDIPAIFSDSTVKESNLNSSFITPPKILEVESVIKSSVATDVESRVIGIHMSMDSLPLDIKSSNSNVEQDIISISPENLDQHIDHDSFDKMPMPSLSVDEKNIDDISVGEIITPVINRDNSVKNQIEESIINESEEKVYSFVKFLEEGISLVSEVCVLCNIFYEDLRFHCIQTHSCISYIPIYQTMAFIHHMRERTGNVEQFYSDALYGSPYYICKCCGLLFKTMNSARIHLSDHKDIFMIQSSSYTCLCNKNTFSHHSYKLRNLLLHSKFVCSLCYNYFSCEKGLISHLILLHFHKNICQKCDKVVKYEDKNSVIEHNDIHMSELKDVAPLFEESREHIRDQTYYSWNALDNHLNYLDGKIFRLNAIGITNNSDSNRKEISLPLKADPAFASLPDDVAISPVVEMTKYTKSKLDSRITNSDVDSYASKELEMNIQFLLHKKHTKKKPRKKSIPPMKKKFSLPILLELNPCLKKKNCIVVGFQDKVEPKRCKYARKAKINVQKKGILKEKTQKVEEEENMVTLSRTRSGMKSKDILEDDNTEATEPSFLGSEITGEWVNVHTFVCCSCGAVFLDLAEIMDHKWEAHPGVWCAHTMIQGQEKVPKIFYEQYLPSHSRGYQVPEVATVKIKEDSKKESYICSQCDMKFSSQEQFHLHIVECGGLNQIVTNKKKTKKGLRFKRRKGQGVPNRRYGGNSLVQTPHKTSSERGSGTSTPNKESSKQDAKRKLHLAVGSMGNTELKNKLRNILSRRNKVKKRSVTAASKRSIGLRLRKRDQGQQQQQQQQHKQQPQQQKQQQKRQKESRNSKSVLNEKKPVRGKRKSQLELLKEAQIFQTSEVKISVKSEKGVNRNKISKTEIKRVRRKSIEIANVEEQHENILNETKRIRRKSVVEVVDVEQNEDSDNTFKPKKRRKSIEIGDANEEENVTSLETKNLKRKVIEVVDVNEEQDDDLIDPKQSSVKCTHQIKKLVPFINKNKAKYSLQKVPENETKEENNKIKAFANQITKNVIGRLHNKVLNRKNKNKNKNKILSSELEVADPDNDAMNAAEVHSTVTVAPNALKLEVIKKNPDDSDSTSEPEVIRNFRQKRLTGRSGLRSRKISAPRYSLRPSVGAANSELEGSDDDEPLIKPCTRKRKYNIGDDESDNESVKKGEELVMGSTSPSTTKGSKKIDQQMMQDKVIASSNISGSKRRKSVTISQEPKSVPNETEDVVSIAEYSVPKEAKVNRRKAYHTFKNQNSKISRFYYLAQKKFSRMKVSCQKRFSESSGSDEVSLAPIKRRRSSVNNNNQLLNSCTDSLKPNSADSYSSENFDSKVRNVESVKVNANNLEASKGRPANVDLSKFKLASNSASKVRSLSVDSIDSSKMNSPKLKSTNEELPKCNKLINKKRRSSDPLPETSQPNLSKTSKPDFSEGRQKRKYMRKCLKTKKKMFLTPEIVDSDSDSVSDVPLYSRKVKKKINVLVRNNEEMNYSNCLPETKNNMINVNEDSNTFVSSDNQGQKCKRKKIQRGPVKKKYKNKVHEDDSQIKISTDVVEANTTKKIELPIESTEATKIVKPKRKYTFKKRLLNNDGTSLLKSKNKKILKEVRVLSYKSLNTGEGTLSVEGKLDDETPEEELKKKPEKTKRSYVRRTRKVDENSPAVQKPKRRRKKEVEESIQREEEVVGFLCTDCGLSFDSALSREDHRQDCRNIAFEMSLMAEDYLYECPYCQLTFALKGTQRKHITSCRVRSSRKNGQRKRRTTNNLSRRNGVAKSLQYDVPSLVPGSQEIQVEEAVEPVLEESSSDFGLIGNRLVNHCQNQAGVKEIGSLLLEYKLCTNRMRSLLTSATSLRESDTIIEFKDGQIPNPSFSQGLSYQILQDILKQAKLSDLSEELSNTLISLCGGENSCSLSVTINITRPELLKALSILEDVLKEASEVESCFKRQQMLLTMKETFQADTGS